MGDSTGLVAVEEALVALEIDRLYEVCRDHEASDVQRREAVAQSVAWLSRLWRDERGFLQRTVLPLVAFRALEAAVESGRGDNSKAKGDDEPLAMVLRRLCDCGVSDGAKEFFVRHVAVEFQVFATVLGSRDHALAELSWVVERFISITSRSEICVEILCETISNCLDRPPAKKELLEVVNRTHWLMPDQKVTIFLQMCSDEPAASVRECAARWLQGFAVNISSSRDLLPLLEDRSQKVRRVAAASLVEIGLEAIRDDLGDALVPQTLVAMALNVSGPKQEKRFTSLVHEYFARAASLDDICELSIALDEVSGASPPFLRKIVARVLGDVLKPSHFEADCEGTCLDSPSQ